MKHVRKNGLQREGRANKGRGIGGKMRPTFTRVGTNYGVDRGIMIRTLRDACSAGRMIPCQGSKGSTGQWIQEYALPFLVSEPHPPCPALVSVGGSLQGKGARVP